MLLIYPQCFAIWHCSVSNNLLAINLLVSSFEVYFFFVLSLQVQPEFATCSIVILQNSLNWPLPPSVFSDYTWWLKVWFFFNLIIFWREISINMTYICIVGEIRCNIHLVFCEFSFTGRHLWYWKKCTWLVHYL